MNKDVFALALLLFIQPVSLQAVALTDSDTCSSKNEKKFNQYSKECHPSSDDVCHSAEKLTCAMNSGTSSGSTSGNAQNLRSSYTYNTAEAQKSRLKAMEKYKFPYQLNGVDRRKDLSYQEYVDVYDGKWPVVVTDVVPEWPASNWTMDFLRDNYGQERVSLLGFSNGVSEGLAMPLYFFLDHIHQSSPKAWTYIQDELFLVQRPQLKEQILDHMYSHDNLFDLFPEPIRPWDAFFLLGTAHSRSHLHVDPYNWTGTSAVLFGHKKWKLIIPGQDSSLRILPDQSCGFPLDCEKYNSRMDLFSKPSEISPGLHYVEADCYSGDMLIIPTGWFHQAYNVEPTLAISGQIMNPTNHLVVMEEILKVDESNLRASIPSDFDKYSPKDRVKHLMSHIPAEIIAQGTTHTQMVKDSVDENRPQS